MALAGRIVTLDAGASVVDAGVVYCRDGSIVAVRPRSAPPPQGFETVPVTQTGGTVFPGLIELHNHLPYNILGLWQVPRTYTNRDQWSASSNPAYHQLITGPMQALGADPAVVPAIVRYVEIRALLAGTTTSQGIALAKSGIISHFKGLVRNVESTHDAQLPPAATHIADIDATDAEHFLARISGKQKLILHLGEGTDSRAHDAFAALHLADGRWAITGNLIGIHCLALTPEDFTVYGQHGGSMVWSPLSNLLLYGQTAQLGAAMAAGVRVALGSDWAPSGSKNLLGELKVAHVVAPTVGANLTTLDLVRMATTTPAALLGWDRHLGSLEPGKRADLIVVAGHATDPYRQLIDATEADLDLVMINGTPRAGRPELMISLVPALAAPDPRSQAAEAIRVGGQVRLLNLSQATADSEVASVTVGHAIDVLTRALADLPHHAAKKLTAAGRRSMAAGTERTPARNAGAAVLAASGVVNNHMSPRPHLPLHGRLTGPNVDHLRSTPVAAPAGHHVRTEAATTAPLPALTLEPLTAVDNPAYYQTLADEQNIPPDLRSVIAQGAGAGLTAGRRPLARRS
jgi:cytosine/adenosine deaminase-related metal-dependent hydrolase